MPSIHPSTHGQHHISSHHFVAGQAQRLRPRRRGRRRRGIAQGGAGEKVLEAAEDVKSHWPLLAQLLW